MTQRAPAVPFTISQLAEVVRWNKRRPLGLQARLRLDHEEMPEAVEVHLAGSPTLARWIAHRTNDGVAVKGMTDTGWSALGVTLPTIGAVLEAIECAEIGNEVETVNLVEVAFGEHC